MKRVKKFASLFLCGALMLTGISPVSAVSVNAATTDLAQIQTMDQIVSSEATVTDLKDAQLSRSQQYVLDMGKGWNLGNSFDGVNTGAGEADLRETAWGNPVVTKDLIDAVAAKGYTSIRMPLTLYRRYDEKDATIQQDWLARYKEVVDWAVEDGLHVMINIHHDSWIWLSSWDGNESSTEYVRFTRLWEQLAAYFADEPDPVCFETINEPTFQDTGAITAQDKLDKINLAAYHAIRNSGGSNDTRMIVMPTMDTNHGKCAPLYDLITSLNDENIIATIHYYSEWVYSANLGKTGFDEVLWDKDYTPRKAAQIAMDTVYDTFTSKGIGVVVGEYGLLGYDAGPECNQPGEELKYYEYMNELARQRGICLCFWDNGSAIDRNDFHWKKPLVGEMLEASMQGRSSYTTGPDTIYMNQPATEDLSLPLTLNGNGFVSIAELTKGVDYTYDAASSTVTLHKNVLNRYFDTNDLGVVATLTFHFTSGADWVESIVRYQAPVFKAASGTTASGIDIPVDFNGSKIRRITAYQASGKVGPNSGWWDYLQLYGSYAVDYKKGTLTFNQNFFADSSVKDGLIKCKVEMYDGQIVSVWMKKDQDCVQSDPSFATSNDSISVPGTICLYEGETDIPAQYLQLPEGARLYGTWVEDSSVVQMDGWPATMTFSPTACDHFTNGGVIVYYMDEEIYSSVSFGVKKAPVIAKTSVEANKTAPVSIRNLDADAKVTYSVEDPSIASVNAEGIVTGRSCGTTTLSATVEQYGRKDTFSETVTVTGKDLSELKTKILPYAKNLMSSSLSLDAKVFCQKHLLKHGRDYKITIEQNGQAIDRITKSGTYQLAIHGVHNYSGTIFKKVTATKHEVKMFGHVIFRFWTLCIK